MAQNRGSALNSGKCVFCMVVMLFAAGLSASDAVADPGGRGNSYGDGGRRDWTYSSPSGNEGREVRRQEFQRSRGGEMQREQRMSPEERRQLREDIQNAGREIYPVRR